jgi:hypothetical protein
MVTSIRKAALTRPKSLISTGEDRRAQIILDSNGLGGIFFSLTFEEQITLDSPFSKGDDEDQRTIYL